MNLQQLQYVLAVASTKHFDQAAQQCFISQSTLSIMVAKFEEEIGIKIFNRSSKPIEITKEGEIIIEKIRQIQQQLQQLQETVKELKNEMTGHFKLAVIPTVAPYLLPLFLKQFSSQFPAVQFEVIELTTQQIIDNIKKQNVDAGILSTPLGDAQLAEIKLYDEPFVFYNATHHKSKLKQTTLAKQFDNIWLLEEGHCMRNQGMQLCNNLRKNKNISNNITYTSGSIDSLIKMVKNTHSCTLLPYLATYDWSKKELQFVQQFQQPTPSRTIGIVHHPLYVKRKMIQVLYQCITQAVTPILSAVKGKKQILSPL